jgi:4a-hydroxytetrahydrobiopterin dehydratase
MPDVHQCPHCELRFGSKWEVQDHLDTSHEKRDPAAPPGWHVHGNTLRREFELPSFREAIAFVHRVADLAEAADHHPDIDIRYRRVILTLSSHDVGRITDRDRRLAAAIGD